MKPLLNLTPKWWPQQRRKCRFPLLYVTALTPSYADFTLSLSVLETLPVLCQNITALADFGWSPVC